MTGGPAMNMLDSQMLAVESEGFSIPRCSTASCVCAVVAGSGVSRIGEETISWAPKDIFTLPQGN